MLAQNFKTATDLHISDVELLSLIKVLGMLERDELIHGETPIASIPRQPNEFNMAASLDNRCGTIGCIAGWACHISGGEAFPEIIKGEIEDWALRSNKQLLSLFGIGRPCGSLYDITPSEAATALRSYLTTGDAKWHEAVA
jgi:hypothetical protein